MALTSPVVPFIIGWAPMTGLVGPVGPFIIGCPFISGIGAFTFIMPPFGVLEPRTGVPESASIGWPVIWFMFSGMGALPGCTGDTGPFIIGAGAPFIIGPFIIGWPFIIGSAGCIPFDPFIW